MGRRKTYLAIAAGVITAVFSTCVLKVGDGILAHATTEELTEMAEKFEEHIADVRLETEKADAALTAANAELKTAHADLTDTVNEYMKNDAATTAAILKDLEWIRRGVDRLMKNNALKPEYR